MDELGAIAYDVVQMGGLVLAYTGSYYSEGARRIPMDVHEIGEVTKLFPVSSYYSDTKGKVESYEPIEIELPERKDDLLEALKTLTKTSHSYFYRFPLDIVGIIYSYCLDYKQSNGYGIPGYSRSVRYAEYTEFNHKLHGKYCEYEVIADAKRLKYEGHYNYGYPQGLFTTHMENVYTNKTYFEKGKRHGPETCYHNNRMISTGWVDGKNCSRQALRIIPKVLYTEPLLIEGSPSDKVLPIS